MRYKKHWNPFNTEVIFYSDDEWDPSVDVIKKIINTSV